MESGTGSETGANTDSGANGSTSGDPNGSAGSTTGAADAGSASGSQDGGHSDGSGGDSDTGSASNIDHVPSALGDGTSEASSDNGSAAACDESSLNEGSTPAKAPFDKAEWVTSAVVAFVVCIALFAGVLVFARYTGRLGASRPAFVPLHIGAAQTLESDRSQDEAFTDTRPGRPHIPRSNNDRATDSEDDILSADGDMV